jgi:YVTN family beta-propeller protein
MYTNLLNRHRQRVITDVLCTFALLFSAVMPPASQAKSVAQLYVANTDSGTVSVVNSATNTEVTQIPGGTSNREVDVTPDGTRAYVAIPNTDEVAVIDTSTSGVVTTIPVGDSPRHITISPDGGLGYVSNWVDELGQRTPQHLNPDNESIFPNPPNWAVN